MPGRPVIAAAETLPAPLPGWYGKLPGLGDFAARRLDKAMVGVWDGWLQDGLQALRQQPGWLDAYLQSPVWCFALGAGVLGPQRWLGVMMPSVDAVGRYFPLAIFFEGGVADSLQNSELLALTPQALEVNFDVIINATASSLAGADVPVPAHVLRPGCLAYDMMYGPAAQGFLDWARRHGAAPRDGLGMLVEQAAEAFALWRGVRPPSAQVLAELRSAMA